MQKGNEASNISDATIDRKGIDRGLGNLKNTFSDHGINGANKIREL